MVKYSYIFLIQTEVRIILNISICDDRQEQLAKIHTAALEYFKSHSEWTIQINCFDNSLLFLESLEKTGGCDIALLDICMPGILGTEVAKEIRKRRDKTEIIFLTTSDEYAIDAFALKATHYLMKPFTQQQFDEAMDRAMLRFADGLLKTIVIKPEGGGAQAVDINEILYIESRGHLLTVYTKNGSCTEGQRSLARLLEELEKQSPSQFISPYKGFIVNQKAIKTIEKEQIILRSGHRIPIPKRGFRELQNNYFDYMFPQNCKESEGVK